MTLKPYHDLLRMSKEKIDDALAPIRAMRARKQAELEIAKMDEKMATQEAKVHELCTEKEIDFLRIIDAQDEYSLMERRRKQLQKIITEMFPE